jgi:general secretion pathway protein H
VVTHAPPQAAFERDGSERGFTLIELLLSIALMALLAGVIVSGSSMMSGNRLRSAAGLMVTAVRLAVTRTNVTGHSIRLAFDLDEQRLVMEESADRMLRVRDKDSKESEGTSAGADPATEAEKQALEYADGILKGPRAPRAKFKPTLIGSNDSSAEKGRELGRSIHYRLVQTEHDSKPRTKGRAYLYFWPGGGTERAVIQLQQGEGDEVLSVLVSPLTGRAKIQRGKVDFTEPRRDEDFGMREAER